MEDITSSSMIIMKAIICLRPAFVDSERYMVYQMEIYWSDIGPGLMFRDKNPGYEQGGQITVPIGTPFLHF